VERSVPSTSEVRLLATSVLGYGFSRRGFELGLEREPHLIGCDSGTTDFGPAFLGSGRDPKSRMSVERDLEILLSGAKRAGAPLVIGSCGGAGAAPHLEGFRRIVTDIAKRQGLRLRVALVHADQSRDSLHAALDEGRVSPLGPVPDLTHAAIDESSAIVAMCGTGALMDALAEEPDVILAGRCADPAIFACLPVSLGLPLGPSWHAGKSLDKGYLATNMPRRGSPVLATVRPDDFVIEPMLPDVACTADTVARITMHENPDPFSIKQPSGSIMTSHASYQQIDSRRVLVTGSEFELAARPSVKLEGAKLVGYRAVLLAGLRDPRLLARLDDFLAEYRSILERVIASIGIRPDQWSVAFRAFGYDAVLGPAEPRPVHRPHEVGLVVDVVAETQEIALAIAGRSSATGSRLDITGELGGGGNFAYPFSPNVLTGGPVYEWSVWHVLETDDEREPFSVEVMEI
jgi:Acyclic terpene utilisation family protein AtuA